MLSLDEGDDQIDSNDERPRRPEHGYDGDDVLPHQTEHGEGQIDQQLTASV